MNVVSSTFVDWRPISSIPIELELMYSSDWKAFDLGLLNEQELVGDFSDIEVLFRYACRSDGLFLFQVNTVQMGLRTLTLIASSISHKIKEDCGHFHVFDRLEKNNFSADLTTYPVLADHIDFICKADMADFVMRSFELGSLRSKSVHTGDVSERKAILTIKKIYSRLFDRVSERAEYTDGNVSVFSLYSRTPYGTRDMAWGAIAVTAGLLLLLFLDTRLDLGISTQIIWGSIFLGLSLIVFSHIRQNVDMVLIKNVKLYQRLVAYCAHGNNLSRVLWEIYQPHTHSPSNDFDPIIKISETMIQAATRRINNYKFYSTVSLSLIGISLAMVI